ncbi:MAG: S8/S53 family peptidase [Planctomycetes bacterium]|nr:S8/S53 family peptidase [Planctomycetota bacterium]
MVPTLLAAALFATFLAPQDPAPAQADAPQRYAVRFRERSFDLSSFAAAVAARQSGPQAEAVLADLEARMRADQAPFVDFVERLGGRVVAQWWLVNGCAIEVRQSQLAAVRAHPRVADLQADHVRRPGRFIKTSTNANNHGTDSVQALGIRGEGAVLAVVDSGADVNMAGTGRPHATFFVDGNPGNTTGGGIAGSRLLANQQIGLMSADDLIAHGTAVASVAAGARWNQGALADDGHAPRARIVSYSVADDARGGTGYLTLTSAWQRVAADRLRYGISVAVCSYEGYVGLLWSDQDAIDSLARNADVLVVGMGGNEGATGQPALFSYSATNMLAVGATEADTRRVAGFSTRGPLLGETRFYPDLVANGVTIRSALADGELTEKLASGTSYSAPQVAGAALLYRSLKPLASAEETKAAILVTTEDIAGKNVGLTTDPRNAHGTGYLRVDRLVAFAAGQAGAALVRDTVSNAQPTRTYRHAVQAGRGYAFALTWFRNRMPGYPVTPDWSNLDLEVRDGTTLLASAAQARDLTEFVRFLAPRTTVLDVTVRLKSLETSVTQQSFALAASESSPVFVAPSTVVIGMGCTNPMPTLNVYDGRPIAGQSYTLKLNAFALQVPVALGVGVSNTQWGGIRLPLDLSAFGAPGCLVHTSFELLLQGRTGTGSMEATFTVGLPAMPSLVGETIYHQAIVLNGFANPLGVALSPALRVTVGGER